MCAAAPLTVTTVHRCHGPLLLVAGDVDHDQVAPLASALDDILVVDLDRAPVTVDLSGVSFADAALLHALLDARRQAEERGVVLRVARPSRPVARLLEAADAIGLFVAHRAVGPPAVGAKLPPTCQPGSRSGRCFHPDEPSEPAGPAGAGAAVGRAGPSCEGPVAGSWRLPQLLCGGGIGGGPACVSGAGAGGLGPPKPMWKRVTCDECCAGVDRRG
ncbi:STAS domain-containing protein, partial [Kitasatospora sp. NPDC059571]|uniref:STAS domain-containing protein n=1 Tax=Kitasatospora sp. NPDC059571 TaxID=3346871 RepID=UPI0036B6C35D